LKDYWVPDMLSLVWCRKRRTE